ncbi:MAG: HAD-IA family hydrolase [Eubacterium sp.]|nr:HAD-IA family hydrolase [Eubacterium sp.]
MAYRCIVFDFDGTLADTEELAFEIYNELAKKYKYHPVTREELMHIKNLHIKEIMEIVDIPFYKLPRVISQGQKRMRVREAEIRSFTPNIKTVVDGLREQTEVMGILTSNVKRTVASFLKHYAIDGDFDFLVSSALLSKQKKIRKVLKRYNLKKEELLYIGDETRDIEACHRAGVDVAAVSWGYNSVLALKRCQPTYMVERIEDILEIVKEKR